MDSERMDAARQLVRKFSVNHAMALEPGLTIEGVRHDINPEMSLPARPGPGMAFMLVRFVHHLEALRFESLGQLLCDEIGGQHAAHLRRAHAAVNGVYGPLGLLRGEIEDDPPMSSLERVVGNSA
jgi:hypothetical protein